MRYKTSARNQDRIIRSLSLFFLPSFCGAFVEALLKTLYGQIQWRRLA